MKDWIIGILLVLIIGPGIRYIVKHKKRGVKCIGCPCSNSCSHNCDKASGKVVINRNIN